MRAGEDALLVNWCEVTVTKGREGKVLYHNALATNHLITDKTVAPIVNLLGRTHWKMENENNNLGHARPRHLAAVNMSDTTLPQLPDELFSEMLSHLLGESAPCRKAATLAATLAWRLKMADPATSTVAPAATTLAAL